MSETRTVAFCDILGFTDLVAKTPLDRVVSDVLGFLRKALHHSLYHQDFPTNVPTLKELQDNSHIAVTWFSDSILLYTRDDTDESVRRLLQTLAWLHFETITKGAAKIRSAVSYGAVHIDPDNSIFVGTPIIEAYRLEEAQDWSGGALTGAAVSRLPADARAGTFANWWVKPYAVPLKDGAFLDTLAINWSLGIHPPDWQMRWSKESQEPTDSDWVKTPAVARKFENTRKFHETFCFDCEARPNKPIETGARRRRGSSARRSAS